MNIEPLPLLRFLDPRPAAAAAQSPICDAVNIPLDELEKRTHELPSRRMAVKVVGPEDIAGETVDWLSRQGRKAVHVTKFEYADRSEPGRLWKPNDWLHDYLLGQAAEERAPGDALDLGCGNGREAVYLAAHSWRVLAVDRLPDAIEMGRNLATRYLLPERQTLISWSAADLLPMSWSPGRQFDLVSSFFFFDRRLVSRAKDWLVPRGILICEAFTTIHQQTEGKPSSAERVVKPGEMQALLSDMEILRLEECEHPHGHTVRVLAQHGG